MHRNGDFNQRTSALPIHKCAKSITTYIFERASPLRRQSRVATKSNNFVSIDNNCFDPPSRSMC